MPTPCQPCLAVAVAALLAAPAARAQVQGDEASALRTAVVTGYAAWCHRQYAQCEQKAAVLQAAVAALLATPQSSTLAAAREAWIDARVVYDQTEALRFCDGPIEPLEPLLNA